MTAATTTTDITPVENMIRVDFTAITDDGDPIVSYSLYDVDTAAEALERLRNEADLGHLRLLTAHIQGWDADTAPLLFDALQGECELSPITGSSVTVIVGTARIVIKRENEGVIVDLYDNMSRECLNTMGATWEECLSEKMNGDTQHIQE